MIKTYNGSSYVNRTCGYYTTAGGCHPMIVQRGRTLIHPTAENSETKWWAMKFMRNFNIPNFGYTLSTSKGSNMILWSDTDYGSSGQFFCPAINEDLYIQLVNDSPFWNFNYGTNVYGLVQGNFAYAANLDGKSAVSSIIPSISISGGQGTGVFRISAEFVFKLNQSLQNELARKGVAPYIAWVSRMAGVEVFEAYSKQSSSVDEQGYTHLCGSVSIGFPTRYTKDVSLPLLFVPEQYYNYLFADYNFFKNITFSIAWD